MTKIDFSKVSKRSIIIGIGCFLMAAAGLGLCGTRSQYINAIGNDLGYSTSFMTAMVSVASLATAVTCLFFSYIQKVLKTMRAIMLVGTIMTILGYLIPTVLTNQVGIVIGFLLQGAGLAFLSDVPLSTLVNNWFVNKPGTILGFCLLGSGLGGVVFNPIVAKIIAGVGWKVSYVVLAVIACALMIPILIFGKDSPDDVGKAGAEVRVNTKKREYGFKTIFSLRGFIPFLIIALLAGCCIPAINHNASPILVAAGIDAQTAALMLSVIYASLSVAKIVLGYVNDRFGTRTTINIQTIFFLISVVLLIVITEVTHSVAMGFVFAVLYGFSYSWQSLAQPCTIRALFEKKYFTSCLSVTMAILHFGSAISTALAGIVKDLSESYTPILIIYGVCVALAFIGYQILFKKIKKPEEKTCKEA